MTALTPVTVRRQLPHAKTERVVTRKRACVTVRLQLYAKTQGFKIHRRAPVTALRDIAATHVWLRRAPVIRVTAGRVL